MHRRNVVISVFWLFEMSQCKSDIIVNVKATGGISDRFD